MLNNWAELSANIRKVSESFAETNPKTLAAYRSLGAAAGESGALDLKTRELIALAVAVTTRCDGCIASHAAAAAKAGASKAELNEALATAIALNAGAAFVYSMRTLDAFQELGGR